MVTMELEITEKKAADLERSVIAPMSIPETFEETLERTKASERFFKFNSASRKDAYAAGWIAAKARFEVK